MKKLLLLLVLALIIISCKKSSEDDPEPVSIEKYKVTYSFTSLGLDTLEYIKYLDQNGNEIAVTDTNEYSYSFEQPKNNIHARVIVKGSTGTLFTAFASYSLEVTDKNNGIIYIKESETDGPGINFTWNAEYKNIGN